MKVIKYTTGIIMILIIGFGLWRFLDDMNDFSTGVQGDVKINTLLYKQSNATAVGIELSNTKGINYGVGLNDLNGIYEYIYEYNTEDWIENHYLEFRNKEAFYYGTSDDFDDAREGYDPGFFVAQIEDLKKNENIISFKLKVSNSLFYKQPITPLYQANGNELWGIRIRNNFRNYKGEINGDTITINTKDFDPRKFIKKK